VAAFLRVINVLENIRASTVLLQTVQAYRNGHPRQAVLIERAGFDIEDAIDGLRGGGLHPQAVADLRLALGALSDAGRRSNREQRVNDTLVLLTSARAQLED
jgi:hypothetical protein